MYGTNTMSCAFEIHVRVQVQTPSRLGPLQLRPLNCSALRSPIIPDCANDLLI